MRQPVKLYIKFHTERGLQTLQGEDKKMCLPKVPAHAVLHLGRSQSTALTGS